MSEYDDELIAEARADAAEERRRERMNRCSDGFCGADDCPRCRPESNPNA